MQGFTVNSYTIMFLFIWYNNFLASAGFKVFGRTYVPVCNAASDWPRTFLHPRCFCLLITGKLMLCLESQLNS